MSKENNDYEKCCNLWHTTRGSGIFTKENVGSHLAKIIYTSQQGNKDRESMEDQYHYNSTQKIR